MCRNMLGSMPPPRPHNYLIYKAIFVFSLALLVASSAHAFGGGGGKSRKSSVYRGTGVDSINVYVGGQKKKNCPAHSSEQNGECVCDTGYQMFDDACKPAYRATCRREGMVWCEEFKACVEKEEDCEGLCPSERSCGSTCCSEGSTCSDGECCLETESAALCCPSGEKAYVHFWNGDKDESELACCNGTPYKAWGSDEFGWYEQRCCTDGTIFCAARDNSGKCLSEGCCTDSVVDGLGANGADLCCAGGRFDCTSQDRDGNCLEGACSYTRDSDEGDSYCKTDKDCDAYTQICENGQCINRCPTGSYMSGTGYCVPISHGCVSNADCEENEYCDITSSLFRCTAPDTGECKPIEYRYNVCEGDDQYESQINDRTMRVSANTMSWWSADNWCKAQGLRLISLGDLGLQKPTTKGCFQKSCSISNDQWYRLENEFGCASESWGENSNFWVTESYDACRAYYVQPSFRRVHPYNRYGDGLFRAVCAGAVCPEGQYRLPDGSCAEECGTGMAISGGNCVCAESFVMEDGACVCPGETSLVNGRCECPEGQKWTGEVCCPTEQYAGTMCCEEGKVGSEVAGQPICCSKGETGYISYKEGDYIELSCCRGSVGMVDGSEAAGWYRQECCGTTIEENGQQVCAPLCEDNSIAQRIRDPNAGDRYWYIPVDWSCDCLNGSRLYCDNWEGADEAYCTGTKCCPTDKVLTTYEFASACCEANETPHCMSRYGANGPCWKTVCCSGTVTTFDNVETCCAENETPYCQYENPYSDNKCVNAGCCAGTIYCADSQPGCPWKGCCNGEVGYGRDNTICCDNDQKAYCSNKSADGQCLWGACCSGVLYKNTTLDDKCISCPDNNHYCTNKDSHGNCTSVACCPGEIKKGIGANGADVCYASDFSGCKTNDDCASLGSNYFCNLTGTDNQYPSSGTCLALGGSSSAAGFVKSSARMNWWAANNWCQAKGLHLVDVSELGCYLSGTNTLIESASEHQHVGCCVSGETCSLDNQWYNKAEYSSILKTLYTQFGSAQLWSASPLFNNGYRPIYQIRLSNGGLGFFDPSSTMYALCH